MTNRTALENFNIGMKCSEKGDYRSAIDFFTAAILSNPTYVEAYINRAKAKSSAEGEVNIIDALIDFDKAVNLNPNNSEALIGRGNIMIQLNPQDPDGLKDLEKAGKIDPDNYPYWSIGTAKMQLHDYSGMLESFQNYLEFSKPQDWSLGEGHYYIGLAFYKMKKWEEAIDNFSKAISMKATINYHWAYFNRANSYSQLNNLEAAFNDYNIVIDLKPDLIVAYLNRSLLFLNKNLKTEALKDLFTALSFENENIKVLKELSRQLVLNKEFNLALIQYSKLVKLQPFDFTNYQKRGTCYLSLHKYEESITDFDKAIEIDNSSAPTFFFRGLAYYYLNKNQACDDWKVAFELGYIDAKQWMDKHCTYHKRKGLETDDGQWIPLDFISDKP